MTGRGSDGTELLAGYHPKQGGVLTRLIGSRTASQERGNDREHERTHTSKLRCKFADASPTKSRSFARARSALAQDDMSGRAFRENGEEGEQDSGPGVHIPVASVLFSPAASVQQRTDSPMRPREFWSSSPSRSDRPHPLSPSPFRRGGTKGWFTNEARWVDGHPPRVLLQRSINRSSKRRRDLGPFD